MINHQIKKLIFVLSVVFLLPVCSYAQMDDSSVKAGNRLFVGGNLGVQFGTVTIIDISPNAHYYLTKKMAVGFGLTYQYYQDSRWGSKKTSNIYGGRFFTSYSLIPQVFAHAEYELLNIEVMDELGNYARKNVASALVGGGYRQAIGPRMYSEIMILWNLTESVDSPYTNPIYRIGFIIGL